MKCRSVAPDEALWGAEVWTHTLQKKRKGLWCMDLSRRRDQEEAMAGIFILYSSSSEAGKKAAVQVVSNSKHWREKEEIMGWPGGWQRALQLSPASTLCHWSRV